ncbi:hypothetical protein PFISCL1PPCAC_7302, partial [Pristionchus fissidentatus]
EEVTKESETAIVRKSKPEVRRIDYSSCQSKSEMECFRDESCFDAEMGLIPRKEIRMVHLEDDVIGDISHCAFVSILKDGVYKRIIEVQTPFDTPLQLNFTHRKRRLKYNPKSGNVKCEPFCKLLSTSHGLHKFDNGDLHFKTFTLDLATEEKSEAAQASSAHDGDLDVYDKKKDEGRISMGTIILYLGIGLIIVIAIAITVVGVV